MIYLIGGAPRTGKSILGQRVAASLRLGWISTDLLVDLLRAGSISGVKTKWNATPDAIRADAEWFFPYLGRFIWGVNSSADSYLVEGVDFLPEHVARISVRYQVRAVFLGCSTMTLKTLDQFPGRSRGYAGLPDEMRRQITQDVPLWSEFVRQECERFGYPYVDMTGDFHERLGQAEAALTTGT